jgi:uncharacterized membrane protein YvbJ
MNKTGNQGVCMPYCPKCGAEVAETMTFCPNCGTQLKGAAPSQPAPTQPSQTQEKAQKNERQETQEKRDRAEREKAEHGFMRYLVAGLVLITIAVFAILELTNPALTSGQYLTLMLLVIGLIIILAAVYTVFAGRKNPTPK